MLNCSSVLMCVTASLWVERQYRICGGLLIKYKVMWCENMARAHVLYGLCQVTCHEIETYACFNIFFPELRIQFSVCTLVYLSFLFLFYSSFVKSSSKQKLNWQHVLWEFFCIVSFMLFPPGPLDARIPRSGPLSQIQTIILISVHYVLNYALYYSVLQEVI